MMKLFKNIDNNFVISLSTNFGEIEITESEYHEIMQKIQTKPADPEGFQYKLRADNLEWELVELPPIEPEPLTDEQALTRYANELTGADDPDLVSAAETLIKQRMED
jgi:hypothetical protein